MYMLNFNSARSFTRVWCVNPVVDNKPNWSFQCCQYTVGIISGQKLCEWQLVKVDCHTRQNKGVKGSAGLYDLKSSRMIQSEQLMPNNLSLCTVVMKQMWPLENTNRKAAEKLYKNHSHRGQRYQLDFYNCCLQLEQGLMLRQEVVKRTISKWQLRKLQRSGEHMQCTASWVSEIIVNQFISACITIMLNFDWSAVSTLIGSMLAVVHHLYSHENSGSFDGFSDSDTGADVDKVYCRNIRQPLHMK